MASSSRVFDPETSNHRFIQFNEIFQANRYRALKIKGIRNIRSICWDSVEKAGQGERLAMLLPSDSPWRRFFDIMEPAYPELVYEFWSTFDYSRFIGQRDSLIIFRLGGLNFKLTLAEFAIHSGIYTYEEVNSPLFTQALTSLPLDVPDLWRSIGSPSSRNFRPCEAMKDPLVRYMARVLSETIRGRATNHNKPSTLDHLNLYSIFNSVSCNIAHCLAEYFIYYRLRIPSFLGGGAYITRLAKSLGAVDDQILSELSKPEKADVVNFYEVVSMPFPEAGPSFSTTNSATFLESSHSPLLQYEVPAPQYDLPPLPDQIQPGMFFLPPDIEVMEQTSLPPSTVGMMWTPDMFDLMSGQTFHQSIPTPMTHYEQRTTIEVGPSTLPSEPPPQVPEEVSLAELNRRVKRISRQNRWLIQSMKEIAATFRIQLPAQQATLQDSDSD